MRPLLSRVLVAILLLALPAAARSQSLGTFRWQLQPYCNVLTMTVVQQGGLYRFEGTDDQCGGGARAGATGLAFLNTDGSVSIGVSIVTVPGGSPVHVEATISIGTLSGTWRDSAGATGAFVFTPGAAVPGSPRPGSTSGDVTGVAAGTGLTGGGTSGDLALAVDFATTQRRVGTGCPAGQLMTGINQDGTVTCQAVAGGGGGDITAVFAGDGLTGGATAGDATLGVAFGGPGSQALAARSDHTHAVGSNTRVGTAALGSNTTGQNNVALGQSALQNNVLGDGNVAVGTSALAANTASENTAVGNRAMELNTTGQVNVAVGGDALLKNTTGSYNTAIGWGAMYEHTSGESNVALGRDSLLAHTSGNNNVAVGDNAFNRIEAGDDNTALGRGAGDQLITGSGNIYIGSGGAEAENTTIRIGSASTQTFISGIRGVTTGAADAIAVVIDSNGQLGTVSSSRRTKRDIEPLGGSIAFQLQRLRPVQFRYTAAFASGERPMQYGLIAEEVEEVLPELVAYNATGEVETVKYHVLPTLLLAEVQRLERERDKVARELAALQATVDRERAATARELAELRGLVEAMVRLQR